MENLTDTVLPGRNLERIFFKIRINAQPEKVYKSMLDKENYKKWTQPFTSNSHFEGNWEKGSKIVFLGGSEDGSFGGLIGRVKENSFAKKVTVEYFGIVEKGKEITSGDKVKMINGTIEEYTFEADGTGTNLTVSIDVDASWKGFMLKTWPEALEELKNIIEN